MITRRKLLALLLGTTVAATASGRLRRREPKAGPNCVPPHRRPAHLQGPNGFCVLLSCRCALTEWKKNPLAPRESYHQYGWHGDGTENHLPMDADTVRKMKEILLWGNPSVYRELFPEDAWNTPFRLETLKLSED